jgi:hypothetical protein
MLERRGEISGRRYDLAPTTRERLAEEEGRCPALRN